MKTVKLLSLITIALLLSSCQKTVPQAEYDRIVAERDSQAVEMQQMSSLITVVNNSMNTIAQQESMLFINAEDGKPVSKKEMLARLEAFQKLIDQQRSHIDSLQNVMKSKSGAVANLQQVINALKDQLAEKQLRISELEQELTTKNTDILHLKARVESVTTQLQEEKETTHFLEQVAQDQDAIINEGYFIVGSKKELKDLGLVSGIFKKKANYANIDKTHFTKIDIRKFNEINLESQPKLITEKPASSYTVRQNADGSYTLRITNPTEFWSASPFLIIQSK